MDASSELIHGLVPVFLTSVLGASMVTIGVIEGVAEATASIAKVVSGTLSDWLGRRKWIVVAGYGLSALAKPLFPLASSVTWVLAGRLTDRIGKGIRGAPRDALVADITPPALRGAAYGLRQALDSVGAFVGPLLAVVLMAWMADDIRAVLWVAVVPAVAAVVLLAVGIREPDGAHGAAGARGRITAAGVRRLPRRYWLVVALGAAFTLARFSEAFLVLRAQDVGLAIGYVPAVMVVMNLAYAGVAYPAGRAADRLSARPLFIGGLAVLLLADVLLAMASTPPLVFAGAACWGIHMGLTQGLLSTLVADASPAAIRGTAFGVYNIVSGGILLLASVIAGSLWSAIGPSATFMAGALFAGATVSGVMAFPEVGRRADMTSGVK